MQTVAPVDNMSADYAVVMCRKATQLGADLLAGLAISLPDLESSDFIPIEVHAQILDGFGRLHDQPDWGFHLGRLFTMANHGQLGFGAVCAPAIRDGLAFLCRYMPTRTSYASCALEQRRHSLHVIFRLNDVARRDLQVHCETFSMIFESYIESAGADPMLLRWRFPYPEPRYGRRYGVWLSGTYRFSSPELRLEVPNQVARTPSAFRNEAGFSSATAHCESTLMQMSSRSVVEKVEDLLSTRIERRAMEAVPHTPIPTAEEVADRLGLSRRQLIRKLEAASLTFQGLKDRSRRACMTRLLADSDLTIDEIAERLDYSGAASLTRACRRLVGATPARLRGSASP